MKILVVGSGGREHALIWGLARSPMVTSLIAAPGNAGIAEAAACVPVGTGDLKGIVTLADDRAPDLVVVGPEAPLVAGLADELRARGHAVFGPDGEAARIEGSKSWAKRLMVRAGIPTARAGMFSAVGPAVRFIDELGRLAVVKADGLAAGKGVMVATDRDSAVAAVRECLESRSFGDAGATVLVEEKLEGPEVSAFALCDGATVLPLTLSQDFKRAGDGDTGPNTGGMGAYSPLPFVDLETEVEIWDIARRSVDAMAGAGVTYRGLLYVGLMLTDEGPKVLEYNCRFGDPETEAVIPRLQGDLADVLHACATGSLRGREVGWTDDVCVTVMLASGGYPGPHDTGLPIDGLEAAGAVPGVTVFHVGTEGRDGRVVTSGGRVLAVSALGATIAEARSRAYEACGRISFEGKQYRKDIAAGGAIDVGPAARPEDDDGAHAMVVAPTARIDKEG